MRLALVISSLQAGGAERVMATLASAWAERGDDVTLITLDAAEHDFYPLDPRVRRVSLNLCKATHGVVEKLRTGYRRVAALRRSLREIEADVVISFADRTNLLILLAAWRLPIPVIVSERIDPRYEPCPWHVHAGRRLLYPLADAIVVQTKAVAAWAGQLVSPARVAIIPNPVPAESRRHSLDVHHTISAVGRLHRQKGFDVLIEAFARIAERHPQWSLEIFGEGPEWQRLETLIHDRRLSGRVKLRGVVVDIKSQLVNADLFVLSSRYEGFPNALVEAMSCGCPVIATDCPSGPAEIIRPEHDGLLVPPDDAETLAASMIRLIGNEAERRRLGANAARIHERFGLAKILAIWDSLFSRVLAERGATEKNSRKIVPPLPAKRVA